MRVAQSFEQPGDAFEVKRRVPGAVRPALEIGKSHRAPNCGWVVELFCALDGDAHRHTLESG